MNCPPSCRFPPLRVGNRRGAVPPASRGNLKEGVSNLACFCKLCPCDWYYFLRRRRAASPAKPAPNASMLAGSGSTRRRNSVTLSRGERTGMQIVIAAPKQTPPPPQLGQLQGAPPFNLSQFMRRTHDMYLAAMREDRRNADFSETKRATVRIRGVQGIRSDYEYIIPHPVSFLSMPVRGYLITLPLSPTEVIYFNAYCPPNSFGDYEKVFDQIIATTEVRRASQNPFGGWQ